MKKLVNACMSGAPTSNTAHNMNYRRNDIGELYTGPIHIYSCRAECQQDVLDFINTMFTGSNRVLHVFFMPDGKLPDTMLEFGLAQQDNQTLLDILEKQPDSHVMMETLRQCPLAENSLQRQYEPYPLNVLFN